MTDYTKDSGTGQIMIRDTGSTVEFWFIAGYSSDWYNGLEFSWTANGSTTTHSINYPTGASWYKVGSVGVSTSQTVTFKLVTATGVGGIGGPTSLSAYLNRATVPSAPNAPVFSNVANISVGVTFTDGSNGGSAINSRQIGYSLTTHEVDGTTISYPPPGGRVAGLLPGKTYYFWSRTHNAEGYSAWSVRSSVTTMNVPSAPAQPLLASITADTADVSWTPPYNGGATILGYEVGYGPNSSSPTWNVSASSPFTVTGLTPGSLYYFFVRAKNVYGWGAWSKPASARTVAGAYILVGTTWKLAVPYVRVGGIWKPAETWVRNLGTWSRTT